MFYWPLILDLNSDLDSLTSITHGPIKFLCSFGD